MPYVYSLSTSDAREHPSDAGILHVAASGEETDNLEGGNQSLREISQRLPWYGRDDRENKSMAAFGLFRMMNEIYKWYNQKPDLYAGRDRRNLNQEIGTHAFEHRLKYRGARMNRA